MSKFIIVMGPSGCGKSTSISTLDPKETIIFNVLGKTLPFKGSMKSYTAEQKNIATISAPDTIISSLSNISEKMPQIKNIVIDDATYIMRIEFFNRCKDKGYDKYNELADHFRRIIALCNTLRQDLNIIMMLHSEPVESEGSIITHKSATVGKLLDKIYSPEENVSVLLYAQPIFDDKGKASFGFYTHKKRVNGIEIAAKSPEGMFKEDYIPNDLKFVTDSLLEYYGV